MMNRTGAFTGSTIVHLLLFILFAYLTVSESFKPQKPEEVVIEPILSKIPTNARDEDQPLAEEMIDDLQSDDSTTSTDVSSVTMLGSNDAGIRSADSKPEFEAEVYRDDLGSELTSFEKPVLSVPDRIQLQSGIPEGSTGDPYAVVDTYDEALDRITEEIVQMLTKQRVLLVWCFDQSESMKDDQEEIRNRIDKIYQELGELEAASGDALLTTVTSYGERFMVHTRKPTSKLSEISAAIAMVPNDPSGLEMMCQGVQQAIYRHHPIAKKTKRRMALILVTDESGDPESNRQQLEPTIMMAQQANCRVYVLGREAAFGRQTAHVRWIHPQTEEEHWLPIDRGPETAFPEQLKTDGRHLRSETHASGFGPYEQTRLARYTGGIFFMLPSSETDLVRGDDRKYEISVMRRYQPDLRSRGVISNPQKLSPMRWEVSKIAYMFDPAKEEVAKTIQIRTKYSADPLKFQSEILQELDRARRYRFNLVEGINLLKSKQFHREQESSPRWQANYDLMLAQLTSYYTRCNELVNYLEQFAARQQFLADAKPGFLADSWILEETDRVVGEKTPDLIQQSSDKFKQIIEDHDGTPWAARSEWELERKYGVKLIAKYKPLPKPKPKPKPGKQKPKGGSKPKPKPKPRPKPAPRPKPVEPPPIPIPKL